MYYECVTITSGPLPLTTNIILYHFPWFDTVWGQKSTMLVANTVHETIDYKYTDFIFGINQKPDLCFLYANLHHLQFNQSKLEIKLHIYYCSSICFISQPDYHLILIEKAMKHNRLTSFSFHKPSRINLWFINLNRLKYTKAMSKTGVVTNISDIYINSRTCKVSIYKVKILIDNKKNRSHVLRLIKTCNRIWIPFYDLLY